MLLIDSLGRALLTLRKLPPEADCWSILGGKVHFLEALEHCAIREAREEAGVEIAIERLLCVTDHLLPGEGQHWVFPAFLGRIVSGAARNCEPHKTREVRWVPARPIACRSDYDCAQRRCRVCWRCRCRSQVRRADDEPKLFRVLGRRGHCPFHGGTSFIWLPGFPDCRLRLQLRYQERPGGSRCGQPGV